MSEARTCLTCGSQIPVGAPAGQCIKCLFGYAEESKAAADSIPPTAEGSTALGEIQLPGQTLARQRPPPDDFEDFEFLTEGKAGGMGVVYRVRQRSLNRVVGLKMIRAGSFATEREVERFRTEAEAAASLDHPQIVPIYQVGEHEGRHYFTMKWIEGRSLAESLSSLAEAESGVAKLMCKIALAIQHAHERGILHRDLKPANILIDAQGEPHITDFGLAKRLESDLEMTVSGAIMGTPGYMSPEQARGKNKQLTTASDIFSLGAIFYQLLTGRTPFTGETPLEIIRSVIEEEPARPRSLKGRLDRDLETICLKCLQKDPHRRYASAGNLATDLQNWLERKPIMARPVSDWERLWKWVRRHPAVTALSVTVLASILIGLLAVSWQLRRTAEANVRLESQRADNFLAAGKAYLALDTLAQIIKKDPHNRVAAERLVNILNQRVFLIPNKNGSFTNEMASTDCVSRDGKLRVKREGSGDFRVIDVGTSNTICFVSNAHSEPIRSLQFSNDGTRIISASSDSTAKVWDAHNGSLVYSLTNKYPATWAEFSPDGSTIVTATEAPEAAAWLWNARTGTPALANPMAHANTINSAHFSPDGKLVATASEDYTARLWEADSGSFYSEPLYLEQAVEDARFAANGNDLVVTRADGTARVYAPTPGMTYIQALESELPIQKQIAAKTQGLEKLKNQLGSKYAAEITCLDLSTNRDLLATASSDKSARLWNARTLQPFALPLLHETTVNCVRFSPDGQRLVTSTAGPVTRVRIWDTQTGQPLTNPIPSEQAVAAVEFSSNGCWIVTDAGWKWRLYPIHGAAPGWLSQLAWAIAGVPPQRSNTSMLAGMDESLRDKMFNEIENSVNSVGNTDELAGWAKNLLKRAR